MAKFLFWSDLHCEFDPFDIPSPAGMAGALTGAPSRGEIDGILIGGDAGTAGMHLELMINAWDMWRVPVISVAGNHEPYGATSYQEFIEHERLILARAKEVGADIDVLRCGVREIAGTKIIGTTLWTDMRLRGIAGELACYGKNGMNDYQHIRWNDGRESRLMAPEDTISMHHEEIRYIIDELDKPHDGPVMVLTHHSPVIETISPWRKDYMDPGDAAYFSDHWHLIGNCKVDAWLHGHSHSSIETILEGAHGKTAFLSNMRGYPFEKCAFDPYRVIDSENPRTAFNPLGGVPDFEP